MTANLYVGRADARAIVGLVEIMNISPVHRSAEIGIRNASTCSTHASAKACSGANMSAS